MLRSNGIGQDGYRLVTTVHVSDPTHSHDQDLLNDFTKLTGIRLIFDQLNSDHSTPYQRFNDESLVLQNYWMRVSSLIVSFLSEGPSELTLNKFALVSRVESWLSALSIDKVNYFIGLEFSTGGHSLLENSKGATISKAIGLQIEASSLFGKLMDHRYLFVFSCHSYLEMHEQVTQTYDQLVKLLGSEEALSDLSFSMIVTQCDGTSAFLQLQDLESKLGSVGKTAVPTVEYDRELAKRLKTYSREASLSNQLFQASESGALDVGLWDVFEIAEPSDHSRHLQMYYFDNTNKEPYPIDLFLSHLMAEELAERLKSAAVKMLMCSQFTNNDTVLIPVAGRGMLCQSFLDYILKSVRQLEALPNLVLQIPVCFVLSDLDTVLDFSKSAVEMGFKMGVTGYSLSDGSFFVLEKLQPSFVSLEDSFVSEALHPKMRAKFRRMGEIISEASFRTMAYGVSSHSQLSQLFSAGVRLAQGPIMEKVSVI